MGRGVALAAVAVLLLTVFAGCSTSSKDGIKFLKEPFKVTAPTWYPGLSWTWNGSQVWEISTVGSDGSHQDIKPPAHNYVTEWEVFNVTASFMKKPHYFAWEKTTSDDDEPANPPACKKDDEIVIVDPETLAADGRGYASYSSVCGKLVSTTLYPYESKQPPRWTFPLEPQGASNFTGYDDINYRQKVLGQFKDKVLGQEVTLVRVEVRATQVSTNVSDFGGNDFIPRGVKLSSGSITRNFQATYDWSPLMGNMVRADERDSIDFDVAGSQASGGVFHSKGVGHSHATQVVVDYKSARRAPLSLPRTQVHVNVDADVMEAQALQPNATTGERVVWQGSPITLQFDLVTRTYRPYVGSVDTAAKFNRSRFDVQWSVRDVSRGDYVKNATGESLTLEIDLPGTYMARMRIVDRENGDAIVTSGAVTADVLAKYYGSANLTQGAATRTTILEFPSGPRGARESITFLGEFTQSLVPLTDAGSFVLVDTDGNDVVMGSHSSGPSESGAFYFYVDQPGTYRVDWVPSPESPVSMGASLTSTVTVQYPHDWSFAFYTDLYE